ncbi:unnamed protein product [Amaranthus hypochondriacus]
MKLSLIFIILPLICLCFNPCLATNKPHPNPTTFIKKCCTTATYPTLCYTTLSPYATQIQNNPKKLAAKSLIIALLEAQSASKTMARLSRVRGLRPKVKAALLDCTTAVEGSAAQLERSIQEMGQIRAYSEMAASDVQTWTSTALTYAGTCKEGFEESGVNGNVKKIVEGKIGKLSQLTSNALALVKHYYVSAARNSNHNHKRNHP